MQMTENKNVKTLNKFKYLTSFAIGIMFAFIPIAFLLLNLGVTWEGVSALATFGAIMFFTKFSWEGMKQNTRLKIKRYLPFVRLVEVLLLAFSIYLAKVQELTTLGGTLFFSILLFDVVWAVNFKTQKTDKQLEEGNTTIANNKH
jgi:prepilin signal peptidase PulO-like enzyme (type II secretory pathway)